MRGNAIALGSLTLAILLSPGFCVQAHGQAWRVRQQQRQEIRRQRQEERQQRRMERQAARAQKPGPHAGDWLRRYQGLTAEQQQKALESDADFQKLPPLQQQRLRTRLERFNSLPPQQRERILQRMEVWEHLTPEQQQRARQIYAKVSQLPPDRRRRFGAAVRNLSQMTPEQRDRVMNSDEFKNRFNEDERQMLGEVTQLPLAPGEAGQDSSAPDSEQP